MSETSFGHLYHVCAAYVDPASRRIMLCEEIVELPHLVNSRERVQALRQKMKAILSLPESVAPSITGFTWLCTVTDKRP